MSFSIFGVGNSEYPTYAAMAVKTNDALIKLGAKMIY